MSNETLPELTSLYLDWENQRQLLGEAEILEKEFAFDIIPDHIGGRKNIQGRTFKVYKIRFVFRTLTDLGKTRYQIGVPHNNLKMLEYKKKSKIIPITIEDPLKNITFDE